MEIITQIKIKPQDVEPILKLIRRFNSACNHLSEIAFRERLWHWHPLQKRAYRELRGRFGLTAAAALVAIRKVAYAYCNRARRKRKTVFKPLGAIPLFKHVYYGDDSVRFYGIRTSYKTRPGISLPKYPKQGTLIYRDGRFYIHQAIEIQQPKPYRPRGVLGCDLGIKNILTDSTGERYSGSFLNNMRKRHSRLRAKLQSKGTKSSKRLLKRRRLKERRFARDVNHRISKLVLAKAQTATLAVALEDLKGIRERAKVRKAHRRQHYSWAFGQLRSFIEYKAGLQGIPVVLVNPKNTSITCPACGSTDSRNRSTRELFNCIRCGFGGPADAIAATNIGRRASSNWPNEPRKEVQIPGLG